LSTTTAAVSRRSAAGALLSLLLVVAPACGDGEADVADSTPYVELDGSPRHPDAEGILVAVDADFVDLTLDGDRTYKVAEDLQCFSTQDGATVPLLQRVGEYVHVGIEGDTVVWVASIADIVDLPDRDLVHYVGTAVDLIDGALVFADGTVLETDPKLDLPPPPKEGVRLSVTIDAAQRRIVEIK
jgi:hypothetical protein